MLPKCRDEIDGKTTGMQEDLEEPRLAKMYNKNRNTHAYYCADRGLCAAAGNMRTWGTRMRQAKLHARPSNAVLRFCAILRCPSVRGRQPAGANGAIPRNQPPHPC